MGTQYKFFLIQRIRAILQISPNMVLEGGR